MRTCQSCGAENPPDRDFCSCGEYLRWEPTGFVQAITPEMAAEAAQSAPPAPPQPEPPAAATPPPPQPPAPPPAQPAAAAPPQVTPAAPPPEPESGNGHSQPAAPPPPPPTANSLVTQRPPQAPAAPVAKTLVRGAVPPPAPVPAAAGEQHDPATVVLRLPDGDPAKGEVLHQAVEPGQRERVLALIRNQSGIVDNYDLRIEGMPEDWYSIFPATVYLVPFGAGGTYEQEVEVHLHPPRGPEAEARVWELKVVADSKANRIVAATAPLALHIQPYIETATSLRPQRKKGRRKADFDVTVANKANAPVLVALDGEDPDGEMSFAFNRPPQEIPAGASVKTQMRVRPPKQIWIGRAQDRRLEVKTVTGEEAAARAAAEPLSADVLANAQPEVKKKWYQRRAKQPQIPGVYGPRVYKPQLYPPDVQMGPGGLNVRMPQFRAPQVQGPQLKSLNASELAKGGVKLPGRGGAPAPSAPLLPTQGVFRQKAWLPWWLIPVLALLLLLLFLLLRSVPQTAVVPDVVGDKSAFAAEEKLTAADLKLDPNQKQEVSEDATPGTVLKQTPAAGEEVEKGTPVAILVAVGTGTVDVPDITKKNASDADKALREKELTLGQASPTGADPKALIETQIPAPGEVVKRGTPVNIFYPDPTAEDKKSEAEKEKDKKEGKGATAPGAGEGAEAAEITVPPIAKQTKEAYAKAAADLGIVPVVVKQFNDARPDTLFQTKPEPGTKVKKGAKVQLLVSVGQPQVVFTNEEDIKRVDGRNGAPLEPVAEGTQEEEDPTYNAAGTHVAYTEDGQVKLKNLTEKNAKPVPLTTSGTFADLAWAPTGDTNLIAMRNENPDGSRDMCLASVGQRETTVECVATPNLLPDRTMHWNPNGREIIAHAVKAPLPTDGSAPTFGIARWRLKRDKQAFSPNAADWNTARFVSDVKKPGKGALDAAISPDGKQLAVVSNQGSSFFKLFLTVPGDYKLEADEAKGTPVRACKVAWRGDSQELIVVQSDVECREQTGSLVRLSPKNTTQRRGVAANGDDPVFQPFILGG